MTADTETPRPDAGLPAPIETALDEAETALVRLDSALALLSDGDLHRAHRDGGWTVAQVVSHINMATVVWLGDLRRLEHDPGLRFFFREEIGHDLTGYPPPTIDLARAQLAATRRSNATAMRALGPELLAREVEIPDLGTMSIADWMPLIVGHAAGHVDQAFAIMRDRGFAPEGV